MKRVFCILLTVLVLLSAAGLYACAQDMPDAVTRDEAGIHMEKGDVLTVQYQQLEDRCNKPVPKGGHIEWYWGYYGGKADFTLSQDQKSCTVRASQAGMFALGCEVYDAQGRQISSDALVFDVSSPFYRFINTVTLGIYGSVRLGFWRMMAALTLLPLNDIL